MRSIASSGVWEAFVPDVPRGSLYKLQLRSRSDGARVDRADPFSFVLEAPPRTASIFWPPRYEWADTAWMSSRTRSSASPISIYEVHLPSWARVPEEGNRPLGYRELAPRLSAWVREHGYTHVALLPVMEQQGLRVTGYFAPAHRQGKPEDFMYLVDHLHQQGIGVILDWVLGDLANARGASYLDGSRVFEGADPSRREIESFLLSSALFWLERYHADGLRIGLGREARPSAEGARFLRTLEEHVRTSVPTAMLIADGPANGALVTHPGRVGGLGFDLRLDVGWMHDTLRYLEHDPIHRRWHHNAVTFRAQYAFDQRYIVPLSHDVVAPGQGSLLNKMPGDRWQKFANLRALLAHQLGQPGKKLLFMGSDFGQWREWDPDSSLDWHLAEHDLHRGLRLLIGDLNRLYRSEPALHRLDCDPRGFRWIDGTDAAHSVLAYLRHGEQEDVPFCCVVNFTPIPRYAYRIGAPAFGDWIEVLNTDSEIYGGSGVGNLGRVRAVDEPRHGLPHQLELTLPPLGCVLLRPEV